MHHCCHAGKRGYIRWMLYLNQKHVRQVDCTQLYRQIPLDSCPRQVLGLRGPLKLLGSLWRLQHIQIRRGGLCSPYCILWNGAYKQIVAEVYLLQGGQVVYIFCDGACQAITSQVERLHTAEQRYLVGYRACSMITVMTMLSSHFQAEAAAGSYNVLCSASCLQ